MRAGETHIVLANVRRLVAASAGYLVERVRQSAKGLRANARNKSLLICEIAVRRHRAAPDLRCEPAHGQRGFSLLHKKLFSRRAQTGSNSSALRPEERRGGKEWVSTGRSGWAPSQYKKN